MIPGNRQTFVTDDSSLLMGCTVLILAERLIKRIWEIRARINDITFL
ncbi:hypothetical protein SAMN05518855_1006241 [Paenibacillus sp. CF384]|nr:hypothetical protein SAMN05518855_1006241 [Paenibacillus sp. CF384]